REDWAADSVACDCQIPETYLCDHSAASPAGCARGYTYAQLGAYSFTLELGRWIQPPGEFIDPFCRKIMNAVTYLLDRPFISGLSGLVTDAATGLPIEAEVRILEIDHSETIFSPRTTDPNTGRYYRFLMPTGSLNLTYHPCHKDYPDDPETEGYAPDSYTLQVIAAGYDTVTVSDLQVTNDTLTVVNVEMNYELVMNGYPVETESIVYSCPTVRDLNHDEIPEIVVASAEGAVHVIESDGNEMQGWPVFTNGHDTFAECATPAIGDINHDGQFDIALASVDGSLYAWQNNGTDLPGFPVEIGFPGNPSATAAVTLCDIDSDGKLEIFVCTTSYIHAYKYDGSPLEGWPVNIDHRDYPASVAVADIDNDGVVEIVGQMNIEQAAMVVIEIDGTISTSVMPPETTAIISAPALVDVFEDGYLEIFAQSGHYLMGVQYNGTELTGFPVEIDDENIGDFFSTPPAIGDLDRNGLPEIVLGFSTNDNTTGGIMAYHHNGTPVDGFPINTGAAVLAPPILVDLYDDPKQELVFSTADGWLHVVDHEANPLYGFPFRVSTGINSAAAVADFDGDFQAEIVVAGMGGGLFAFDIAHPY
ncbi:MAG: hypothetical protein GY869_25400, partial [Planctomycetes bacterium]|nr:hypothetical protein [Planctomycetota bacterium]